MGLAQMTSEVEYRVNFNYWSQNDKWKGFFFINWLCIKDIPNKEFRHLVNEYNENKPVTSSRDTQEIVPSVGLEMLKIFYSYQMKTSIFDYMNPEEKLLLAQKGQSKLVQENVQSQLQQMNNNQMYMNQYQYNMSINSDINYNIQNQIINPNMQNQYEPYLLNKSNKNKNQQYVNNNYHYDMYNQNSYQNNENLIKMNMPKGPQQTSKLIPPELLQNKPQEEKTGKKNAMAYVSDNNPQSKDISKLMEKMYQMNQMFQMNQMNQMKQKDKNKTDITNNYNVNSSSPNNKF